jgi:hypothetical protein
MLPITQHRVFHISNSLATVAAIAAVMTALIWNNIDDAEMAGDLKAAKEAAVLSANRADTDPADEDDSQAAAKPANVDCRQCAGTGLSGLLPLVFPGSSLR